MSFLHNLGELDDDGEPVGDTPPRCCMLGCPCGLDTAAAETLAAAVPAPREPTDGAGMTLPGDGAGAGLTPALGTPAAVEVT